MPDWLWIAANLGLGLPLAAVFVTVGREIVRTGLALALGFRVFEIRWGAGRLLFERPVGPLDLSIGRLPLGGATVARSGLPRRHRAGRVTLALGPCLAQLAWLAGRLATGTPPGAAPLFEGPAPLAVLDLASCLLLVVHATFALELPGGVRTDVRLCLDAVLGHADTDRAARANYYARLARHRLERADVDGARAAIARAMTQLGPEPLLVEAEALLDRGPLDSVVDQGERADALREAILAAEPRRRDERAAWGRAERLRQTAFSGLPVAIALAALAFVQADRLARSLERGMIVVGDRAVAAGDVRACDEMAARWARWAGRVDPWLPPSSAERSERHEALAALDLCRGERARARRHQGEALLAAGAAADRSKQLLVDDPDAWLAAELQVSRLLRVSAERESRDRAHRDALRTISRAERRLARLAHQLVRFEAEDRERAEARLGDERAAIESTRERILAQLAAG